VSRLDELQLLAKLYRIRVTVRTIMGTESHLVAYGNLAVPETLSVAFKPSKRDDTLLLYFVHTRATKSPWFSGLP